jgi:hypothetical protein
MTGKGDIAASTYRSKAVQPRLQLSRVGTIGETKTRPRTSQRFVGRRRMDATSIRGRAGDFDVRHRFVANFIAELPFGANKPCQRTAAQILAAG